GELEVDTGRRTVLRGGRPIPLTLKEYGVLVELVRADGAVVSAEELLARVWDEHADPFTNAVRVTMVGLRRKLGEPAVVETLRGAGYRVVR
ncbi:winged helix-turn-helix transcriptional regulator, partial [Nocardioides sp.]